METRKVTRNIPLKNWADDTARHQIINQAIYEEYVLAVWEKRSDWTICAKTRLEKYGIELAESTLKNYFLQLKRGTRDSLGTSAFGNKLFKDFGCRSGKNGMYKQLDAIEHLCIDVPYYIGLPANQLIYMINKYGNNVFACERDPNMFEFMLTLKRSFAPDIPATIYQADILEILETTNRKFSIYDLDLMQHASIELIERVSHCIARTTRDTSLISIACSIGRSTTEKEYKELMPEKLIEGLENRGLKVSYSLQGAYKDSVTPMRYEILIAHKL